MATQTLQMLRVSNFVNFWTQLHTILIGTMAHSAATRYYFGILGVQTFPVRLFFSVVYTGFRGWGGGPGAMGRGTFLHWRNKKVSLFSNSKIFKNLKKQWKIYNFFENSQIYIQKSQLKTDFCPFSLPSSRTFVILYTSGTYQNFWGWLGGSCAELGGVGCRRRAV